MTVATNLGQNDVMVKAERCTVGPPIQQHSWRRELFSPRRGYGNERMEFRWTFIGVTCVPPPTKKRAPSSEARDLDI